MAADLSAPRVRLVCFQAGVVALWLGVALVSAGVARAATSTIGRTWPIAEPDALAEIEARAARLPSDMAKRFGPRSGWSALKGAALAVATQDRVARHIPFYTLDTDIRLPDGKLLYAKGYTFNPLDFVQLPQRLIVVHPRDLGWALKQAGLTDFILLVAGGSRDDDAITLSERHKRPLFILEERVKARLGLRVAPVIVAQKGRVLELREVRLVRGGAAKAGVQ